MGLIREYQRARELLKVKHQVIFYAEGHHYLDYYQPLFDSLLEKGTHRILYVTSDKRDPLLGSSRPGLTAVYIKWMLAFFLKNVQANLLIMTMPDLDNFIFKRSPRVERNIYLFHAAVSTHQQYRKKAFDNYDLIFCTGAYQKEEIRAAEKRYGLNAKTLFDYGYPLFQSIRLRSKFEKTGPGTILLAPSWFEGSIFDECLEELLLSLSELPYLVRIRVHPEFSKRRKKKLAWITNLIGKYPRISMDINRSVIESICTADHLITDRSGIAFEFAFGTGKPVLFIETKPKVINADYQDLQIMPLEDRLRSEMGLSIVPSQCKELGSVLVQLENMQAGFQEKMDVLGARTFFHFPGYHSKAEELIAGFIEEQ